MATIASLRFFSRLSPPPSHRSRSQLSFDLTHFSPTKNPRKFQTLTLVRASSSSFDDLSSERSANSRSKLGNAYQFLSITRIGTAHDIFEKFENLEMRHYQYSPMVTVAATTP
ncbi:hypothetical protein CK203_032005 [Vitis vinifera]|uniref:Uncharacterized protein n=1 Tax=Vitis vinifera TaxID=29760 RepID=A0A438FN28_VITVI|nr:hypothetical protein CK203_032005 [Vitis vinifera]